MAERLKSLEDENQSLKKSMIFINLSHGLKFCFSSAVDQLSALVSKLELRVTSLEGSANKTTKPVTLETAKPVAKPAAKVETKNDDNDSDVDLFGSDDDEEADAVRKKRLEEYAAKKSKSI